MTLALTLTLTWPGGPHLSRRLPTVGARRARPAARVLRRAKRGLRALTLLQVRLDPTHPNPKPNPNQVFAYYCKSASRMTMAAATTMDLGEWRPPTSPIHLPYISPVSPLYLGLCLRALERVELLCAARGARRLRRLERGLGRLEKVMSPGRSCLLEGPDRNPSPSPDPNPRPKPNQAAWKGPMRDMTSSRTLEVAPETAVCSSMPKRSAGETCSALPSKTSPAAASPMARSRVLLPQPLPPSSAQRSLGMIV